MKRDERMEQLDSHYRVVQSLILSYQDPVSGLFPASANLNHAWVRDNVYTVLAAWGLSIAYKRPPVSPHAPSNIYLLQQSCVKMMRGLLQCMMRQHDKVEKFKTSHSPVDSLHAKYSANSGTTVVSDHDWGHLQLDATSLYLLILAQMTASGMSIIFNLDEVAFIQNLVFYIESAYCIPDYGIWERGDKANHGLPELNASSIGMAKAALEAMSGLNLFGSEGGPSSVIHVMADDSQKCQAVLQSILPRESSSKEIDSGLLSVISFPAFAVDDIRLIEQTRAAIVTKLQGNYGCKRFLRDGYKTPREDPNRLYYEPNELKMFENIECEWPLFFIYLWIDAIFVNDLSTATTYKRALERVLMRAEDGVALVPEMYSVEAGAAAAEAEKPGSQPRHPVGRCPFLWAQSLYIIANLLHQGLLTPEELDPLDRRLCRRGGQTLDVVVQVAVLAESSDIRKQLRSHDVEVQTTDEIAPLNVLPARALSHLHTYLGRNSKLKLTGRRSRDAGILSTSKLYSIQNQLYAFTPQLTDQSRYYVASDSELLIDIFKAEINFLKQSWKNPRGHPLVVVIIKSVYLDSDGKIPMAMITTMKKLKSGYISGTRVSLGRIEEFVDTSCVTDLSFLTCLDQGVPQVMKREVEEYLHEVLDKSTDKKSGIAGLPCRLPRKTSRKISCKGAIKRTRSIVSAYPPDESSRDSFVSDEVLTENESQEDVGADSQAHVEPDSSAMDTTDLPPRHITPTRSRNQSEAQYANTEVEELLVMLRDSKHLEEQGDILQYLIHTHGLHMPTGTVKESGGNAVTLKDILKEVYVKACCEKRWGLVRHAAGTLGKRVEDLAKTLADLLVRQKQITVGMPPVNELAITGPLPEQELRQLIHQAYGQDESSAMLTQELLVYLAMFIRTEPALFSEMLRLRVGLIIQVMAGELMRTLHCSGEEASDHLLNLSPYEMKNLLHHIISGREFTVSSAGIGNYSIVSFKSARLSRKSDMSTGEVGGLIGGQSEEEAGERGQWLRRRRLDGALNKVPADFYTRIWHLLDKCEGIVIEGHLLHHNLTKEMTSGELKFALVVESALTCIPQPEYRQLLVESLAVLSLISEYRVVQSIAGLLSASAIVHSANDLFLKHQSTCSGDATLCCATVQGGGGLILRSREPCGGAAGICQHFYDSAPSGTFGTMTYITKAILKLVDCFPPSGSVDCHIS